MASTPSVPFCTPRQQRQRGGGEKNTQICDEIPPCGRGCAVQPVIMSRNKYRTTDDTAHAHWLYLQALIAGGEQNTGAYTSTEAHVKILILSYH